MKRYRSLTSEEKRIIEEKHTEYPQSGSFYRFHGLGVYVCKRCDAPLYLSSSKFSQIKECGWPSFEEEIDGAVLRVPDADGIRTEIICNRCQGHLGHVFTGEHFTNTNTRHCVNSLSLRFIPALDHEGHHKAIFAGGCFWGVEYFMKQHPGVISVISGYIGGEVIAPTYEEVCTGQTGHLEAVQITFDLKKTSFEMLLKDFLEIHNPFQTDGQGPDIGTQYTSAVFYLTKQQCNLAHKLISLLENKNQKVATKILPASTFYPAENYHQNYYEKNKKVPYCHMRVKRF
jgi:peptide methionine sulfoxide reductase msrA/msrB